MREVSKYLHYFLQNEIIKKDPFWSWTEQSRHHTLSNTSTSIIGNIFQQIEQNDINWDSVNLSEIESEIQFDSEEIKSHFDTNPCNYISEKINESIKIAYKVGFKYTLDIQNRNVTVYLIYPFAKEDPIDQISVKKMKLFFQECMRKIYVWLSIAYTQSKNHCAKQMKIYIYFSEFFKLLPSTPTGVLSRENANTAYTTSCSENIMVNVCRQEEWFKVFIHETFHCLGFDFSHREDLSKQAKTQILDIYNVTSDVNLFETYCEVFANILNCMFYIHYNLSTKSNTKSNIKSKSNTKSNTDSRITLVDSIEDKLYQFQKCMHTELVFSFLQTVKVLQFYGISYRTLIDRTGECDLEKSFFKEDNTNILSYYVIKMICICYLDEYLTELHKMNGKNIFQFNASVENINKYVGFIEKKQDASYLLECIDKIHHWYLHRTNFCQLEYKTMRLTVYE